MVSIRFEDPPDPAGHITVLDPEDLVKNRDREDIIAALADYPDRWAVVSQHRSRPAAAKVARLLRLRHPAVEFRTVTANGGGGVVYGRCPM
jgi:hypothetical protein